MRIGFRQAPPCKVLGSELVVFISMFATVSIALY